MSHPSPVAVIQGSDATLTCIATGSPKPTITWKRVGAPSSTVEGPGVLVQNMTINTQEKVDITVIKYIWAVI